MGVLDYMTPQIPQNNPVDALSILRKMFSPVVSTQNFISPVSSPTETARPTGFGLGETPEIANYATEMEKKYGVPAKLLVAQVLQESNFNPSAKSTAGAVGLSQFMPATARSYGLKVDQTIDERLDPLKSMDAQARFMSDLNKRYGNWEESLSHYNSGKGWKYQDPRYKETYNYVRSIMDKVNEDKSEKPVLLNQSQSKDLSTAFLGKQYKVSQNYGARPSYYRKFGFNGHEGTDISVPSGTPIIAPFDGVVEISGTPKTTPEYSNYGNWIKIRTLDGTNSFDLAHLSQLSLAPGQEFKAGQVIGYTGSTGNSTGPHLHINAYQGNRRYNPLAYTGTNTQVANQPVRQSVNQPAPSTRVAQYQQPSKSYLIKKGNTLSEIAQQNRTTVQAILNKNKQIKNPNLIYAGSRINLA
jgi:murein DD-endopeptidase MepM/ murein hydrolase activator NlpD